MSSTENIVNADSFNVMWPFVETQAKEEINRFAIKTVVFATSFYISYKFGKWIVNHINQYRTMKTLKTLSKDSRPFILISSDQSILCKSILTHISKNGSIPFVYYANHPLPHSIPFYNHNTTFINTRDSLHINGIDPHTSADNNGNNDYVVSDDVETHSPHLETDTFKNIDDGNIFNAAIARVVCNTTKPNPISSWHHMLNNYVEPVLLRLIVLVDDTDDNLPCVCHFNSIITDFLIHNSQILKRNINHSLSNSVQQEPADYSSIDADSNVGINDNNLNGIELSQSFLKNVELRLIVVKNNGRNVNEASAIVDIHNNDNIKLCLPLGLISASTFSDHVMNVFNSLQRTFKDIGAVTITINTFEADHLKHITCSN
ncbi:hypothetical protein GJ496_008089 [Pomphorhynchus laevis]|nr:hypothetical protein GJ496_008089 [Pomphorhynchus laevis]